MRKKWKHEEIKLKLKEKELEIEDKKLKQPKKYFNKNNN